VAKPELGTKRLCGHCGVKFYDLNKDPITCPKCHTVMELAPVTARARPEPATPVRAPAMAPVTEAVVPETQDAEFVSLEEAEAEQQGKKKVAAVDTPDAADEDIELETPIADDDDTFIEEQEEGDEDVTDIIGDVENEEER
jgi:uncharacterized protein (TIGR02300 family)